ncbi:MAG: flagellar export chaperone FlgN [Candidatus Krumholzibacteriota bacterium]|nr:flagellar export chaperone FlgN [Candidatus Krumholzibacteriota bacterium]
MAVRFNSTGSIRENVENLCNMMAEETKICRELLELSKTEQQFLMKNDVENLSRNTDKMKSIIQILKRSQGFRRIFMNDIAQGVGLKVEKITISSLSQSVDEDLSKRLRQASILLMKIGERLYRANHNTVYLIDFSLDLLEQQNKLWSDLVSEKEEGYKGSDQKRSTETVPLLIEKKG